MNNPIIFAPELSNQVVQELQAEQLISSDEVIQARLAICNTCENKIFDSSNIPICKLCNCNIRMMATVNFKTCPLGLWT